MKILYDHQIFSWQKFGGISRYFVELITHLPKDINIHNSTIFSDNVYLKQLNNAILSGLPVPNFKGKNHLEGYINKASSLLAIELNKYDILHPTYYNPYFINKIKRPYVITVYDMIHEKLNNMFHSDDLTIRNKRETIINATKVIAISQNTKEDLIELYGMQEDKIEVVHLGHSVNKSQTDPVKGLPDNYILFVGQRGGYKNFSRFVKAYAIIQKKNQGIKLVCTGNSFNAEEQQIIQSLNIENDVLHYFVTDTQLTYLYQHALCFVYPSLYEGFGIPILEAFASQCPIALSNTSCFPEIACDGGYYFNPYEIDDIADVLGKVLSDEQLRKDLITKGNNVLKHYSWDKMAKETAAIYKNIIQ